MTDQKLLKYLEGFLTESRKQRFDEVLDQRTNFFTVCTEDLFQLHNTSAVIRSCDIFGIQNVHVIEDKVDNRIDKEIAMGAQKWVDVNRYDSAVSCLNSLKEKGYQIVATTPHKDGFDLEDFDWTVKSCFCFGKEDIGLSDDIMKNADTFLKIPMYGFTESLNISVSAAIILQYVSSKLRASEIHWHLSEEEKEELRLKWCKRSITSIDSILERFHSES